MLIVAQQSTAVNMGAYLHNLLGIWYMALYAGYTGMEGVKAMNLKMPKRLIIRDKGSTFDICFYMLWCEAFAPMIICHLMKYLI